MVISSLKVAVAVFGLCSIVAGARAEAGERVLRLGYLFSPTSQLGAGAVRFAAEVSARTGGAVRVEPYPNGTVGGEVEMVEELRAGHLDIAFITGAPFASVLPEFGVFDIPFLFRDAAHAHAVFDGPIGRDYLQKFSAKGLVALAWGENGMRHITNARRPVTGPEDLKGLSMRVPQSEIMLTGFRSLGVKAEPLAFPALYGALQSGQFDGQENPIAVISASHFERVQRHLTLSGHVYSWAALVMSQSAWAALTEDERTAFTRAAQLGGQVSREVAGKAEREGVEALRKSGMSVVATIDRAAFERSLEAATAAFSQTFGAETIRQIKSVQ